MGISQPIIPDPPDKGRARPPFSRLRRVRRALRNPKARRDRTADARTEL